jgi:hypothetical protein
LWVCSVDLFSFFGSENVIYYRYSKLILRMVYGLDSVIAAAVGVKTEVVEVEAAMQEIMLVP